MACPLIPQWLARRAARRVPRDDEMVRKWVAAHGPTITVGVIEGAEMAGYRLVRFDPNTEPGERPIVISSLRAEDLEGITIDWRDLPVDPNA